MQADRGHRVAAAELHVPGMARRKTDDCSPFRLFELVTVDLGRIEIDGVLKEVCEVGEQVELRSDGVSLDLELAVFEPADVLIGEAVPFGVTTVGGINRAEAADQPGVDGPLRDLVGGVP